MVDSEVAVARMGPRARDDTKKKQTGSHKSRPSAVQGERLFYSKTERRPRSRSPITQEIFRETVREQKRRKRSASTRRTSTVPKASPVYRMTTPPSVSTNQRNQRRESNASVRRRNNASSASPSNQRTTPPPRSTSIRRRNTASSISPSDRMTTPPSRSTSRAYSAGTPSLSPIYMRNFSSGSVDEIIESPFQTNSPWRREVEHHEMKSLELEMKHRTSMTQQRSTPTPDRISAPLLQYGQVSPERVPKRPSTNFASNAQTQTQRLHGAVLNSSSGRPARTASRSPSPISPLQTSPALPPYYSSASPTELNPRQATPRTDTSPDSTPEFAVHAKPLPKPSGYPKSLLHVDTSTKTSPK